MSKIDRATLAKVFPDPKSIKAVEDLFNSSDSNSSDVALALKNADAAQTKANAAKLAADNAQASANTANADLANLHSVSGAAGIGFSPTGGIASSTVQAALAEVDAEKLAAAQLAASSGATLVGVAPAGNISSSTLQAALQELDGLDGSGFRNVILNGSFIVNQRNYVSGTATSAANQYTLDRWRVVVSGQSISFVPTNNGNLVTVPAGGFEQVIEGALMVQTRYVLNWLGTATATVNGSAVAKGAQVTVTSGSNCTVRFISGTVGSVQLEQGKTAHLFEPRPYSVELWMCQRYAFGWTSLGTNGGCNSVGGTYAVVFPNVMRATPTYTSVSNGNVADGSVVLTITAVSLTFADLRGAFMNFTASGATPGRAAILYSGGVGIYSAEL